MKPTFEPILSESKLQAAIEHIAKRSVELANVVLSRALPLDTICFFAQSPEEYIFLEKAVLARGSVSKFTHGATLYADTDFMVGQWHISIFGVRTPDPTRPWRGYGDYPVDDYQQLLASTRTNPYAKEIISGRGQSLLELKHPDFDVLGYVVDARSHR